MKAHSGWSKQSPLWCLVFSGVLYPLFSANLAKAKEDACDNLMTQIMNVEGIKGSFSSTNDVNRVTKQEKSENYLTQVKNLDDDYNSRVASEVKKREEYLKDAKKERDADERQKMEIHAEVFYSDFMIKQKVSAAMSELYSAAGRLFHMTTPKAAAIRNGSLKYDSATYVQNTFTDIGAMYNQGKLVAATTKNMYTNAPPAFFHIDGCKISHITIEITDRFEKPVRYEEMTISREFCENVDKKVDQLGASVSKMVSTRSYYNLRCKEQGGTTEKSPICTCPQKGDKMIDPLKDTCLTTRQPVARTDYERFEDAMKKLNVAPEKFMWSQNYKLAKATCTKYGIKPVKRAAPTGKPKMGTGNPSTND